MDKQLQIFLAHASEDKKLVRELYLRLKSHGFKPWLDEIDLIPGQNWQIEIPKAIRESDIFLACLSKRSVQKHGYVQREYRLALSSYAEKPPGSIYLIPVKLDDCEMPDLQIPELGVKLRDIQWIELWQQHGLERLINAIKYSLSINDLASSTRETVTDTQEETERVNISFLDESIGMILREKYGMQELHPELGYQETFYPYINTGEKLPANFTMTIGLAKERRENSTSLTFFKKGTGDNDKPEELEVFRYKDLNPNCDVIEVTLQVETEGKVVVIGKQLGVANQNPQAQVVGHVNTRQY